MTSRPISRRSVLAGGAGLALLAACGGSDSTSTAPTTLPTDGAAGGGGDRVLVSLFDGESSLVPGSPQRATFAIGNNTGALIRDVPESLSLEISHQGGSSLGSVTVKRHDDGLPRAYYPLTFTPPAAGYYEVATELQSKPVTAAFGVGAKKAVKIPGAGDAMPVLDTPTTADHRGVDPICTRDPVCPLHDVNLRDAMAQGRPTALLISTPAYCQTAICGPVLDVVLSQRSSFQDVAFIHAEVYKSAKDAEANGSNAQLAPVLQALHLSFEPVLFLIGKDGRIAQRVDVIVDKLELRQAVPKLLG